MKVFIPRRLQMKISEGAWCVKCKRPAYGIDRVPTTTTYCCSNLECALTEILKYDRRAIRTNIVASSSLYGIDYVRERNSLRNSINVISDTYVTRVRQTCRKMKTRDVTKLLERHKVCKHYNDMSSKKTFSKANIRQQYHKFNELANKHLQNNNRRE
jgi:hypothetical protein